MLGGKSLAEGASRIGIPGIEFWRHRLRSEVLAKAVGSRRANVAFPFVLVVRAAIAQPPREHDARSTGHRIPELPGRD